MDKDDVVYTHTHTHTHTGILLSHKKEWNNAISSNTDGPRDHTKLNKSAKDKYYILLTCGILKNDTNELIYKTEIDPQTKNTSLWLPKEKGGRYKFGIQD